MPNWLSKKLLALVVTILTIGLNKKLGLGLDTADVTAIAGAGGAYMLGQGLSDHQKEAAKLRGKAGG